ncbi:MAG TPA: hypothetical protein VFC39_14960 [Acidobacteriaceae bacterium]|nr:hypothetical protein [Acidobacteriaceae bacterium]
MQCAGHGSCVVCAAAAKTARFQQDSILARWARLDRRHLLEFGDNRGRRLPVVKQGNSDKHHNARRRGESP